MQILDKGYVNLVFAYGSDEEVIRDARMSTDKGFQGWGEDARLLAYLYNHKHMTPFEGSGMKIEVKAPIMVFREWHRHRTQSYNEMSARYVPLPNEDYLPSVERILEGANATTANKQARGATDAEPMRSGTAVMLQTMMQNQYIEQEGTYQTLLKNGMPKELARLVIPVSRYSRMRATANLRNWLAFLTLRDDAAAQWEIQQYAKAVAQLVQENFPRTYALYVEGRK